MIVKLGARQLKNLINEVMDEYPDASREDVERLSVYRTRLRNVMYEIIDEFGKDVLADVVDEAMAQAVSD